MSDPTSLRPKTLEALLRDLDREAFVAFVIDLWERMGWETEHEGRFLIVSNGAETNHIHVWTDDRTRVGRLFGIDPDQPAVDAIDMVVTRRRDDAGARQIAESHGGTVIDPTELHNRLLYGIDRDSCRELCRTHFGVEVKLPPGDPRDGDGRWNVIGGVVGSRVFLIAMMLIVLLAAIGAGPSGHSGTDDEVSAIGADAPALGETPMVTPVGLEKVKATTGSVGSSDLRAFTENDSGMDELVPTVEQFEQLKSNSFLYRNVSDTCEPTPGELVETVIGALRFREPYHNDGVRTVWMLATANGSFERFRENITSSPYRPLYGFDRIAFESLDMSNSEAIAPPGATVVRSVVVSRNGERSRYELQIRIVSEGCWKLQQISPVPTDLPGNDSQNPDATAPASRVVQLRR